VRQIITSLGRYMASPFAFLILFGYGALWFLYKPETFEWHAGATLATWFMTLVIQRAEHRDTQAIHAKLDEMLHVMGEARNELTPWMRRSRRNRETPGANAQGRLTV
jgi:low affinity Fe/Cu permease